MTRDAMRALLRRRLNETTADNWTDDNLNGLLLEGLRRMETMILRVNPEAFLTSCITDLVQDQSYYLKPTGILYEVRVETKTDVSAEFKKIEKGDFDSVADVAELESTGSGRQAMRYAHYGKEFFLGPAPSSSVSGGLRVHFVPSISMANDDDVPQLAIPLHLGIVLYAHMLAIGETGEGREAILSDLKEILADIPAYYRKSGGRPDNLQPDIEKGY